MHPTSVFYNQSDLMVAENEEAPELLAYLNLLETNRAYITGVMRIPGLASLALFAHNIDANSDCSRLVFDDWIEVRLASGEQGVALLCTALDLRRMWEALVVRRLKRMDETLSGKVDSLASSRDRFPISPDIVLLFSFHLQAQHLPSALLECVLDAGDYSSVGDFAIGTKLGDFVGSPMTYKVFSGFSISARSH